MSFGTLTIDYPDGRSQSVALDRTVLRIGRNSDNDLVLGDPSISGYHAEIRSAAGGWQIVDLGSTNGTEADGGLLAPNTPMSIGDGSEVAVGAVLISVRLGASPAPRRAPADPLLASMLGTPPPAPAPRSAPSPAPSPPTQISISIDPAEPVASFTGAVLVQVVVLNRSSFVDSVQITVEGLRDWASVDKASESLLPGAQATFTISIAPPRLPASRAGLHPFEVVARSEKRPDQRFAASGSLRIPPFSEYQFDLLDPKSRTAWFTGRYGLQVRNNGNSPQNYSFEGQNDEGAFRFRFDPPSVTVEPGAQQRARLRARLKLLRLFGRPRPYPFKLTATPADESAPPQSAQGRLVQSPPLPPWLLLLLAITGLIILIAACLSLFGPPVYRFALGFFDKSPTPTPTLIAPPTAGPTIDAQGTAGAIQTSAAQTQAAIGTSLAASAVAVSSANAQTQTAFAQSAGQTQSAAAQAVGLTQSAAAQTASAIGQQQTTVAQTATTFASAANATGTAQGTAVAQTQTAAALGTTLTAVVGPAAGTPTPTTVLPVADEVITFEQVSNLPVRVIQPIRGDEYVAKNALFCFYQPVIGAGQEAPRLAAIAAPGVAAAADRPLFSVGLRQANSLSSISPTVTTAGSPSFVLAVFGAGFSNGNGYASFASVILWNGQPLGTTFVSSGELRAVIPASLVAQPGTAQVSVQTSQQVSAALPFQIVAPPSVSVGDVSVVEGNSGQSTANVNVQLSTVNSVLPILVTLTISGQTAQSGVDFIAPSSTALTIPVGAQGVTVPIVIVGDTQVEPDETLTVTVVSIAYQNSTIVQPTIARAQGTLTIINDDVPPTATFTPVPTPTPTPTPVPVSTATATATAIPVVAPPPASGVFNCQPPTNISLRLLQPAIFPPPVVQANNAPFFLLGALGRSSTLVLDSLAAINFQRNISEANVSIWYPGGSAVTYVLFAFDERGQLVASARRDAVGVPALYQLNFRSVERPVRQVVIEARPAYDGDFSPTYTYHPISPALIQRVELRYTTRP
jgi:hypothetical protein